MKLAIFAILTSLFSLVRGHGYLKDPPSRASRWRYGFSGPTEYTDNQLSCGGRTVQWSQHEGRCGACGDEYGISNPRFVHPGAFANDPPIVKTYTEGSLIEVTVKITANHKGYFIFRVARLVNPPITQADLDSTMLELENGNQEWTLGDTGAGEYTITLRLPTGFSCDHCVLQWWWTTGNNWQGNEPETFVNCADIRILATNNPNPATAGPNPATAGPNPATAGPNPATAGPNPATASPNPATTSSSNTCPPCTCPTATPVVCPTVTPCSNQPAPPATTSSSSRGCHAVSAAASDAWCTANCAAGYCPASHCACS